MSSSIIFFSLPGLRFDDLLLYYHLLYATLDLRGIQCYPKVAYSRYTYTTLNI